MRVEDADGEATAVGGRSGREARLDLLLAEELANDLDLLVKFLSSIDRKRVPIPTEVPLGASVRLNVDEWEQLPSDCGGETDIEVVVSWAGRPSVPILVEDKVWAPFQHRQPERYRDRAKIRGGAAVLVAPKAFLESHRTEAAIFHGCVLIEAVIGWLRDAANSQPTEADRRQWRASLLEELMRRPTRVVVPDDELTVAFTSFCATWFADHGGVVSAPSPVMFGTCHLAPLAVR